MTPWGDLLADLLRRRDLSIRDFAALVGESPANVSKAMRGIPARRTGAARKPPLERIEAWADALRLEGAERGRFVNLAALMHAPERVRAMVDVLKQHAEQLERRVDDLEKRLAEAEGRRAADRPTDPPYRSR